MTGPIYFTTRGSLAVLLRASAALVAAFACLLPAAPAVAAGSTDITSQVLANANVTLSGAAVIDLPGGTTTYTGTFSGTGTLTIAGSGTLVLTKDSDFTLPASLQHQQVTTSGGNWPYPIVTDPDQPAVIVDSGATLQYGNGGSAGVIGDYPYTSVSSLRLNRDNVEVNGTLGLDIAGREFNLGTLSGSGLLSQPRSTWGSPDLADDLPFTGTISDGTGMNFGSAAFRLSLPGARAVDNDGSAIISARDYTLRLPENFYEDAYGSDINFHTWQAGLIVMTGVDDYATPSLDTATLPHTVNFRGINIEGANVQWGDGTTAQFFLPATPSDSYINIHNDGSLAFDYDGPVTLDTPISGGVYHQSLSTPANASVTISPTPGNAVTFATPMNYHGTTTIGHGAELLLGTGAPDGDSTLLSGAPGDEILDDGALVVRDTSTPVTLRNITGPGSLTQSGPATTTLAGAAAYTGQTTISSGTLAVAPGAAGISASSGVTLPSAGAVLDVSRAGDQSVRQLSGAAGSMVRLGAGTLTVSTTVPATFAGSFSGTGGGLATSGSGTLTLTGRSATPGGTWHLGPGTLALSPGARISTGSLLQSAGSTLSLNLGSATPAEAPVEADGAVRLDGTLAVTSVPRLAAGGQVTLIHDSANAAISGAFSGMPQGGKATVDGRAYRIDYAADGGHDVVLASAVASAGAAAGLGGPRTAQSSVTAATGQSGDSSVIRVALASAAALTLAVLLGAAFLVSRRKRRGRPRGHGAPPAGPRRPASPGHGSGPTRAPAPTWPRDSPWAVSPGRPGAPPYANRFPVPGPASRDDEEDTEFLPRYGPRPPYPPAGRPQHGHRGADGDKYGDGRAGPTGQPRQPRR
jgi:autotransporter-associated beta strand protein